MWRVSRDTFVHIDWTCEGYPRKMTPAKMTSNTMYLSHEAPDTPDTIPLSLDGNMIINFYITLARGLSTAFEI